MKKYLLYFLALLLNIPLLAQTVNLEQTGSGHSVNIYQKGDNIINIEQLYGNNHADIEQIGSENRLDIKQGYISENYAENFTSAKQYGGGNYGKIEQNNYLGINYAIIEQTGDFNRAELQQGWPDYARANYYASIIQDGSHNNFKSVQGEDGNRIEAQQTGDYNSIDVVQLTWWSAEFLVDGNVGSIIQNGNYNAAKLRQHQFSNIANIHQNGNNNYAEQYQSGNNHGSGPNISKITQEQNNAYAYQRQSIISEGGSENYAEIYQRALASGENNSTRQLQEGGGNTAIAHTYHGNNTILQSQNSGYTFDFGPDDNWSFVKLAGHENNAEVYQYGHFNAAFVQTYSYWSDNNNISITQGEENWEGYYETGGHYASVYIDGSFNTADIEQYGNNNHAGTNPYTDGYGIEIIGDNNTAGIYQEGNGNTADLHLYGDGLEMHIKQVGDNMFTSITQEN